MSTAQGRLDRLYPSLTARERAVLVLQAWKQDGDEDPPVRRTMPAEQAAEFNRYIGLMNAVNGHLTMHILVLQAVVRQLGTKHGWLASLEVWGLDAWTLAAYIFLHTKEPITKSEHRKLEESAGEELVPVRELAEILTERHEGWAEADMEPATDGNEEPLVSDRAWERVLAEKESEIARLVEEGTIKGKRKGRRLLVNAGSFYGWLGEPVPVFPDWGLEYEVFPDRKAEKVRRLKEDRRHAQDAVEGAPSSAAFDFLRERVVTRRDGSAKRVSWGDEIANALSDSLREGTQECWRVFRAIEQVLEEVASEFEEDPLLPDVRSILDGIGKELRDLHEQVQPHTGPFELPEPDEEVLARVSKLVRRTAPA